MDDLVELLADAFLAAVGMARDPHLDIFEVARRSSVDDIEFDWIPSDGRIENIDGFTRITLKADSARPRQRFTLAHELGHLLLDDPDVAIEVRRLTPQIDDVERLCEAFAAEVLMPRQWVWTRYRDRPQSFLTLSSLARSAGVSMSAALVQLARHSNWPATLLFFAQSRNWEPSVMAGAPRYVRGQLNADYATRCEIQEAFRRHTRSSRAILRLSLHGQTIAVESELKAATSGVLALVPLRQTLASGDLADRTVSRKHPVAGKRGGIGIA